MTIPAHPLTSPANLGLATPSPYRSFWMGGFEGADHVNGRGLALDLVRQSGHLLHLDADYERMAALGLRTVRESIGWRLCEAGVRSGAGATARRARYDFTRAVLAARAAQRHGVQVLWSLMHYGTPSDVVYRDDSFIGHFVDYAVQAAREVGAWSEDPPIYTLVNEINFISWAVSATNLIHPYRVADGVEEGTTLRSGFDIKRRLVQATLAAMDAIRNEDPRARFLHVEPVLHVVAPAGRPELADLASEIRSYQWQAWDMLSGRMLPELGGSPAALDLIGVNHYHSGQWEVATEQRLEWHLRDPRRMPLSQLLTEVSQRYGRPLIVAETSHIGEGRGEWLDEVASEVELAIQGGTPVQGVCLYPVIDRPDWNDADHWHHSGLFDVSPLPAADSTTVSGTDSATDSAVSAPFARTLVAPYAQSLARWQHRLP
ncbi:MAG: amine oxidase [Rhizobacter sp.]|nr:amine oxidase [Rhizobacter sp.]